MSVKTTEDHDNPEWTAEDFARAEGPEALSAAELAAFPRTVERRRGRPRLDAPKQAVSLRLSPQGLERFKATGEGWQSRIDAALARGDLSQPLADVLRNHQQLIASMRQQLDLLQRGLMAVRSNNVDVTSETIADLKVRITSLDELSNKYAPLVSDLLPS